MSNFFSFPRLQRAMLNDLQVGAKPFLYGALVQLAFTVIIYYTNLESGRPFANLVNPKLFALFLVATGLIKTSAVFSDMHNALERYRYLMLPISNFERFLGRYLLTGPLFVIYMVVAFTIMDWTGNFVTELFRDVREPLFEQFSQTTRWTIYGYLGLHALMFTGAICFRSYALIRTAVTVILVAASLGATCYLAMRVFFFDAFSWNSFRPTGSLQLMLEPAFAVRWMNIAVVILFALWILYAAHRCLKAHEVQDEL